VLGPGDGEGPSLVATPPDWKNLNYLLYGTARQQAAYWVLHVLGIFRTLGAFDPMLVGTIPIDLDIPGSDLDLICEAQDLDEFHTSIVTAYRSAREFHIRRKVLSNVPAVVGRFLHDDFPIEIVGQPRPVREQPAFRHMVVEERLLRLASGQAREVIRHLKRVGLKTEPAFAQYFGSSTDPYQRLLAWSVLDDEQLTQLIVKA
jgi:hypothetical protein